jgi:hypothetical protein
MTVLGHFQGESIMLGIHSGFFKIPKKIHEAGEKRNGKGEIPLPFRFHVAFTTSKSLGCLRQQFASLTL